MFQHHGESLSKAWTRFKDLLQKVPHHGIDLWLQVQIFYDHVDCITQESINYAAGGRLRKIRPDKAWDTIKRLAQYENEGWNDAFTSEEVSFNYENPDVEQLLGIMERKVDTLMKNAISLMGKSESAMSKRARSTRGHASSSHNETMEEKPIFRKLAREFFALFEFDVTPCRYDPLHKGIKFRLGGLEMEMHLLEFGWRVGFYSERESREAATLRNTKAKSIRNPRIKLAHRCNTMTITGRKETTNYVTEIDLFYLYCIFGEGVVCNIPYWLAKYLKSVRDKIVIFRGMFVTKIAQSFGLLTNELVSVLNREPPPHVYRKTSLIKMGVIMELYEGECCWPATREVAGEGGGDDEEGNGEGGNEGIRGSTDIYRNMSQGKWQVHQA
ncbi:hypothetical protein Tco_0008019 [Tanacetum coccineum]